MGEKFPIEKIENSDIYENYSSIRIQGVLFKKMTFDLVCSYVDFVTSVTTPRLYVS